MLILNMFIYKSFYGKGKNKKELQNIIVDQMYEIVKIQMYFYQITWYVGLNFFYRCVDFGRKFDNEFYLFSFGQNMKKIINSQSWVLLNVFYSNAINML